MRKNAVVPASPALTEEAIAETVNSRFEQVRATANDLRLQMLGVGFTLVQAERELVRMGKLKRGNRDEGTSLQAWLAAHCPAIPYKTAMDWKGLAEKSLRKVGGNEGAALQLMMAENPCLAEADDAEWTESQLKAREEIYSCETKGALKQMLMPFLGDDRPVGRPRGTSGAPGRRAATAEERAADAEALTRETLGRVTSYLAGAWIETVAPETRDDFVRTLRDCADLAEERARRAAR